MFWWCCQTTEWDSRTSSPLPDRLPACHRRPVWAECKGPDSPWPVPGVAILVSTCVPVRMLTAATPAQSSWLSSKSQTLQWTSSWPTSPAERWHYPGTFPSMETPLSSRTSSKYSMIHKLKVKVIENNREHKKQLLSTILLLNSQITSYIEMKWYQSAKNISTQNGWS